MIKKISIQHLVPNMYIADLNNQWVPSNNKARCGFIKYQSTIDKIVALGATEIYIDTEKGLDCEFGETVDTVKQLQAEQFASISAQSGAGTFRSKSMSAKREQTEKHYEQAKSLVGNILNDIKQGKNINAEAVHETADDLIASIDSDVDTLSCLSFIRSKDSYLLEHSVNVGLLLGVFARSRRLETKLVKKLVSGGLLHDIGKILVPDDILNKPGKLEAEEWEEMKRHVTYGEQILDLTTGLSDVTRSICALHHERLDGSGYPRNLNAIDIPLHGRMSAICDVYDAITADRVYHHGMSPNEALRKLIEWSIFHLDKEMVYDFIRCLSVYPVGTLVELSDGRVGVIIEANRRHPKLPSVRVFYNIRKQTNLSPERLNLADKKTSVGITNTLDARALEIDIRPFL